VHGLSQRILNRVRRHDLLHAGDRVGVAVSGGADSVALLRLLLEIRKELGIVLSVVHVNHKLRPGESDADAKFVASLAREHKLQLHSAAADVAEHAEKSGISIETAARELRYRFFRQLLGEGSSAKPPLDKIVTGHTLDDQAETVLMRIIRGTGMRGLRAIHPRLEIECDAGAGQIIRLLLDIRRRELEAYLRDVRQGWREDATNQDSKFTRNRVRHTLLPLLEKEFNPAIAGRLGELADIARAEEDYWDNEAAGWTETGIHWTSARESQLVQLIPAPPRGAESPKAKLTPENAIVDLLWLLSEPLALQRRIIKSIDDRIGLGLEFKHIEEILEFACSESVNGKEIALPKGWRVRREEDHLEFFADNELKTALQDYQYELSVPGELAVPEVRLILQAVHVESVDLSNPGDHVFDSARLAPKLVVRNWRPGDRFWPAHTKQPKKIKELLQDRHLPEPERKLWPVIVSGDEIVWVRGFPGHAGLRPRPGDPAILIRELSCD
jgi:tRNA(Ile)-lysidine synthase